MSSGGIGLMNEHRKLLLTEWVAGQHEGHLVRCTGEPYFEHVLRVAKMAEPHLFLGYEIGLCHDLLEKTKVTAESLYHHLKNLLYGRNEAEYIAGSVIELTDVYTKTNYPEMSKATRKKYEALRLISTSPAAQTVKYADLYDNIHWVMKNDAVNATVYLQRKLDLITKMTDGSAGLRQQLLDLITSY